MITLKVQRFDWDLELSFMYKAVVSDLNVTEIMIPWVYQAGLPIINVTIEAPYIRATQQRFMKDPDADVRQPISPYGYKWHVPLTYVTQSGTSSLIWINGTDSVLLPDPTDGADWIKFNYNQYMYYRVNYSDELFRRLIEQINNNYTVFSPLDRANLLDDAFNIARAGQVPYEGVLNMTSYMRIEVDWEPWHAAQAGLTYLSDMLYTSADYSLFRAYVQDLTGYRMDKLKVQDGGTHMENVFAVAPNLRRVVYSFGMQAIGGDEEFAIMWDRYTKATSTQEADNILYGLTWTDKLWLIQKLLDYSTDETKIRSQDFFTLMDYIGQNKIANGYLWDWVRANYDYIVNRFGLDNRDLGRMVPKIVSGYNTQFQLEEVQSFYERYPDAGTGEQARVDSLDSIQNNIKWLARSEEQIIDWLEKY
ncbi:hypothetical protein LSH36_179g02013 [Paralvinella palmiformis]|uniref:ERAP1-like C-terminal domain-containing protein n=1 Tax=Paralvinella palmiformis TaxID=53620 RepID=A0AAD9JSS7_9ANNE|nr:hypothetical protein LSH36_179g02013 [Paralvinella palmiformis]